MPVAGCRLPATPAPTVVLGGYRYVTKSGCGAAGMSQVRKIVAGQQKRQKPTADARAWTRRRRRGAPAASTGDQTPLSAHPRHRSLDRAIGSNVSSVSSSIVVSSRGRVGEWKCLPGSGERLHGPDVASRFASGREWSRALFDPMLRAPGTFRSARSCSNAGMKTGLLPDAVGRIQRRGTDQRKT